jgi:hypothetical protein
MAEVGRTDKVRVRVPKDLRSALTAAQVTDLKKKFKASLVETVARTRHPQIPHIIIEIEPIFSKPKKKV